MSHEKTLTIGKLYTFQRMETRPGLFAILNSLDRSEPGRYLNYGEIFLIVSSKETKYTGQFLLSVVVGEKLYRLIYEDTTFARYTEIK